LSLAAIYFKQFTIQLENFTNFITIVHIILSKKEFS